ncbi:MAG: hypothetical protein ACUVTL_06980 [Thermoproteota archaeon]
MAIDALDYAVAYNIGSLDGYLVSLARSAVIYSLDQELEQIKEMLIFNQFPKDKIRCYHEFLGKICD